MASHNTGGSSPRDKIAALESEVAEARKKAEARAARRTERKAKDKGAPSGPTMTKAWVRFFLIVTAVYLCVEAVFNSTLLDVAGSLSSLEEIEETEVTGRLISGFAAALAVFGGLIVPRGLRRRAHTAAIVARGVIIGALVMTGVYYGEKALVDVLVETSTPEERRQAYWLTGMTAGIHNDAIELEHIDIGTATIDEPETKAFLALLPAYGTTIVGVEDKIQKNLETMARRQIEETGVGDFVAFYNNHYADSLEYWAAVYREDYGPAYLKYKVAMEDYDNIRIREWNNYVERLKGKRLTPERAARSRSIAGRVRTEVQYQIPVPDTWSPTDRRGFDVAVRHKLKERAGREFEAGIRKALKRPAPDIKPELDFDAFLATPTVQKEWRAMLAPVVGENTELRNGMNAKRFERDIYEPFMRKTIKELIATYRAEPALFADGAEREEEGKRAMRMLIVPPIALGFSLLGLIVHLFKLTAFIGAAFSLGALRYAVAGAVMVTGAVVPFQIDNAIVESPLFGHLNGTMVEDGGKPVALALEWIIRSQHQVYPIGAAMKSVKDLVPESPAAILENMKAGEDV